MARKGNMKRYRVTCQSCGKKSIIKSNQPGGCFEWFACSCYDIDLIHIPEGIEGQYLYKTRENTFNLQKDIMNIIFDIQEPMTVRQIFYRLVSTGHPKTEEFYNRTQRTLLDLRERGCLPYGLIADNTRSFYRPRIYDNLTSMLAEQQRFYRRDFWNSQDVYVEVWLEKEALRSVFTDVTYDFQVPLYVTKGFSSVSFVHAAAEELKQINKPTVIYLFSDYDPSGLMVAETIKRRLKEFGVKAEFVRPCLTPEQIEFYKVATRPTKVSNHSKNFIGESAELDALHPTILKQIVRSCIEQHIDQVEYEKIKGIEQAEKQTLETIQKNLRYAS